MRKRAACIRMYSSNAPCRRDLLKVWKIGIELRTCMSMCVHAHMFHFASCVSTCICYESAQMCVRVLCVYVHACVLVRVRIHVHLHVRPHAYAYACAPFYHIYVIFESMRMPADMRVLTSMHVLMCACAYACTFDARYAHICACHSNRKMRGRFCYFACFHVRACGMQNSRHVLVCTRFNSDGVACTYVCMTHTMTRLAATHTSSHCKQHRQLLFARKADHAVSRSWNRKDITAMHANGTEFCKSWFLLFSVFQLVCQFERWYRVCWELCHDLHRTSVDHA